MAAEAYQSTIVRIEGLPPRAMMARLTDSVKKPKSATVFAAPGPLARQILRSFPWGPLMVSNKLGSAYGLNVAHGRRDASRRRSTQCAIFGSIPSQRVGVGRPTLDFKAPGPCIRGAPGGEPVATPTIAQTKARNISFPMPGNNKEVPKAIIDRTTLGANTGAQQTSNKGSKGMSRKDANWDQRGKRADFRLFGWKAPPSPSFSGLPAEGSLQFTSLISKGDPYPKAPPYDGLESAVPSSSSSRGGASKSSNLCRQGHLRGLRRKKPRPGDPRLEAHQEFPVSASSASSDWRGWRGWSDLGK